MKLWWIAGEIVVCLRHHVFRRSENMPLFEDLFFDWLFGAALSSCSISSRMAWAAAAGSAARVMGRPTTSREAPWAMAWAGVAMRFWSPMAAAGGADAGD